MQSDPADKLKSTEGMVDYDQNSAAQKQHADLQAVHIRALMARLDVAGPELKIVDYGCGPGMSAIDTVRPAVEAYRLQNPRGTISVCHADQCGNDWNSLFELASGPSGYINGSTKVRVGAAVGSFYDQLVADGSVALGTCFFASHWLSHAIRPHAPGTVWFADLTGKARAEMADFARCDWITFLKHRARELQSGGYLLVSTLGAVPDSDEINGIAASGRKCYRAMQNIAQEMAGDGLLKQNVLDSFVFALWFMTAAEAREPLQTDPVLADAFEMEEISVAPSPLNPSDIYAEFITDPVIYAKQYTGYIRAFADSTLRTQLFEPSANSWADVDGLADEFYRRLDKLYQNFADRYAYEIWHLTIVLRKT